MQLLKWSSIKQEYPSFRSYVLISGLAAAHYESQGIHDLSGDAELADYIE